MREYKEEHYKFNGDLGIAFNENRIWICLDGRSVFRAKSFNGKLQIEFHEDTIREILDLQSSPS